MFDDQANIVLVKRDKRSVLEGLRKKFVAGSKHITRDLSTADYDPTTGLRGLVCREKNGSIRIEAGEGMLQFKSGSPMLRGDLVLSIIIKSDGAVETAYFPDKFNPKSNFIFPPKDQNIDSTEAEIRVLTLAMKYLHKKSKQNQDTPTPSPPSKQDRRVLA